MAFSRKEAPNCDWCPYRRNCLYELLEDKTSRQSWREMRVANRFRPGEIVFYEGERPTGLYVVCTGQVKITKTSRTGQQLVTRVERPGDLLGHRSLLARDNYSGNAEAMEESVVSMVEESAFTQFLLRFPKAALALLRELSHDVRRGEDKARDIAFKPARSRLANVLLNVVKPNGKGLVVHGLKRKDLAEMSGLTIETTVRLIKDFELRGLLKRREKDLVIVDEDKIRSIADRYQ